MELLTIAKNVYRECSEFVHGNVIPELKKKNDKFSEEKKVKVLLCILEVHKNAPQEVKEALRILRIQVLSMKMLQECVLLEVN